jgi:hypothetical protein
MVRYYREPKTQFGEKSAEFCTEIEGVLGEDVIDGRVRRPDRRQFQLICRLTRKIDLPVTWSATPGRAEIAFT